jgi:hypothetical protein
MALLSGTRMAGNRVKHQAWKLVRKMRAQAKDRRYEAKNRTSVVRLVHCKSAPVSARVPPLHIGDRHGNGLHRRCGCVKQTVGIRCNSWCCHPRSCRTRERAQFRYSSIRCGQKQINSATKIGINAETSTDPARSRPVSTIRQSSWHTGSDLPPISSPRIMRLSQGFVRPAA